LRFPLSFLVKLAGIEVGFSRLKENTVETEFREQFIWSSPSVTVIVGFLPTKRLKATGATACNRARAQDEDDAIQHRTALRRARRARLR
jgi:hypothetical protein